MENLSELPPEMRLTEEEWAMIARARLTPITFDEDCPETTPEKAIQFRRVNPVRKAAN